MIKLLKYLKGYIGVILIAVVMLFLQAYCELSLPSYTSNIVNVGIQQYGIDTSIPMYLSKEAVDNLSLFMEEKDVDSMLSYYTLKNSSDIKDVNIDGDKELYVFDSTDREAVDKLSEIMSDPMLIVTAFSSEDSKEKITSMMQLPEDTDILMMMKSLDYTTRMGIADQVTSLMEEAPDTIKDQMNIVYIKGEYTSIGMDLNKIQSNYIKDIGLKMIGLAALGMIAATIVVVLSSRIAAAFSKGIREDVFRKVISFSNAEFDKFSTASLITRSTNDIQQVQMLMMMVFRIVLYAPIMGIGGVVKVLNTNSNMTWIIGLAVGILLMVILCLFQLVMPKFKKLQSMIDNLNLVMREILTGLSVIRAFSTSKHEEERFDEANQRFMKTNLFVNRAMAFMMPIMMFIMNGVAVLIVYKGAYGIDEGSMQVGDMMAFIQYAMQVIMSFLMISMVSIMIPRAAVSGDRINEILQTESSVNDPEVSKANESNNKGEIIFNKVSFKYQDASEDVLSDISFTAGKGKITAIIGSTGSGKSTLVNLIPRFFDVTEGNITINGVDIRDMSQEELRKTIGYVPQKSVLFSGDIDSNIRFGNEDASNEEVEEAAFIAQAIEFINEKPDKFETSISQGGSNVSGGQKQRLSIARAIARHPEVYIFDDSFSALDFKTDVALRKELGKVTKESIVFIVAQRISTILHADQIIVLDDGIVAGIGNHSQLMRDCEVYQQIAASQLSEAELASNTKEVNPNE